MSRSTLTLTDHLYQYMLSVAVREHPVLTRLRQRTAELPNAGMQIAPEQGAFMGLLVELIGAKKTLDVGTFTGYSALTVALALPPDGRVVSCDVSEEYTTIARAYFREAAVAERIDLRIGPAQDTLFRLLTNGEGATFDFAFIDADKTGYDGYYEHCLQLLRVGGLLAIDNVLWSGAVANPEKNDPDTSALRALNQKLHTDARITVCMVPIADGLTLARKR